MRTSVTTLVSVFYILAFASGAAFAGTEETDPGMGESGSILEERPGAVFDGAQRLSGLIGNYVVNEEGERLGRIHDLIVGEDGLLSYLIVARGGAMRIDNRLAAIPISALSPRVADDGSFVIDVDRRNFDAAPTISASNYPPLSNHQWLESARGYFESGERSPRVQEAAPTRMEGLDFCPEETACWSPTLDLEMIQ
jgi:sporulation protein YlmC with PRC-barrel domain